MAQPYGGGAPAPMPAPMQAPAPVRPPRTGGLGTILGIAALAVAVIALVVAAVFPGPVGPAGTQGATGPTGPQGPAGAGTLMRYAQSDPWTTGGLALVGCTLALNVSITVPGPGTIVVTSTTHLWVTHTTGTEDAWVVMTNTSATNCRDDNGLLVAYDGNIPSAWPSGFTNQVGTTVNAFPASAAGQYTFHVTAQMTSGQAVGDAISEVSMVAVFYPA